MTAIIPAAGLGKRMLSVTGGQPKELLSVGGVPVIGRVIEEARLAEADRIVVVSSSQKEPLNDYLRAQEKDFVEVAFQEELRGLAHAVSCAVVHGDSTLVLMADSFYFPDTPLRAMKRALEAGAWAAIAVRQVPRDQLHRYGVAAFSFDDLRVTQFVEKPELGTAPSDWAVAGRFGFSSQAMEVLSEGAAQWNGPGEISLNVVLNAGLTAGEWIAAVPVGPGQHLYDCGDREGYEMALREFGS